MNATVTALPTTKMIAVPRLGDLRRKVLLSMLAAAVVEMPESRPDTEVRILLAAYADDSLHGEQLAAAWQDYLDAIRLEQDTDTGLVTAAEICPELTCPDRQDVVRKMTRQDAAAALCVLVNGPGESR